MPAKEPKAPKAPKVPKEKKGSKGAATAAATEADSLENESPADKLRRQGVIVTFALNSKKQHRNERDISVENLTMTYHGAPLIEEAELSLNYGNRYGFIGRNGCGKSTFMNVIGARCIPIPDGIDMYHVKEEIEATEMTALQAVMSVDTERARLEAEAEELNDLMANDAGDGATDDIVDRLTQLYERLEQLDASTAETRASKILCGLGFTPAKQAKMTKEFSGGWRMRIALARALFIQPTLLLLDEPTNHLDMEAVVWLEDYLSKWNKILFMVSHSQDFLNNVCTHMVHFHGKKLVYYSGNYDSFCNTRAEKEEEQEKRYKLEQDQIKHMKEYVARFGQGNAKMAKQAQSKEKTLDKMLKSGLTDKVEHERALDFKFNDPGKLSPPVLQCNDITFGYPGCEILYSGVDFGVDLDSRVALVGPNGAGKTTLLKIMTGELMPVTGSVRPHAHLRISKFTQHFIDVLNLDMTPLEYFMHIWPDLSREDGRKFLGRFGISGSVQTQVMGQLSDGQKSRVVLAKMAKENPHMLFLDEPTNHLDMESIDSLAKAINNFGGGLVLVSHDMRLISQVAKEIWMCDNRTVTKFIGEINDFKMLLRRQMMRDNLIESDGKAASTAPPAIQFVPLAPTKSFGSVVSGPALTIAPALPPKAPAASGSTEDSVLKARMELAELAIAKQRARQNADKGATAEGAEATADDNEDDEETRQKKEEKDAAKAQRKAEKEAKLLFEKKEEEERIRRKEEKAREIEEAKKLVDEQNKQRDEWLAQKAAKDAKLKEAQDAEAARLEEALAKRREEKEARRKAREDQRIAEEAARRQVAEAAVLADPWTQEQQNAFEEALLTFTSALEKAERWQQVAARIEGKSRNQCMARYRFLKEFILRERREKQRAEQQLVF